LFKKEKRMLNKKQNTARRFTGGQPRPDNRKRRQEEAAERNAAWAGLSAKQKITSLDKRLGKGIGAKRQRAKLAEQLKKAV
jgi:hypothetical protein